MNKRYFIVKVEMKKPDGSLLTSESRHSSKQTAYQTAWLDICVCALANYEGYYVEMDENKDSSTYTVNVYDINKREEILGEVLETLGTVVIEEHELEL